ncbi:TetR/AcrR family transcriptional regulator [Nocardia sp. BMG111209]|uniref:TetR/AcrR family transcriptional regulator n=1 Tax=Nocardia sp. BMG111209 TaxID=1160137 RepID=UPI000368186D|nr:TetR/AcrR family transcriptional regulator [Nocardia sp. BMG111209]
MGENLVTSAGGEPTPAGGDVASRIAQRSLAKREAGYANEIRRLLDAALAEIRTRGTTARIRVADVVAAAGLSNDAFYRHFPSKDALLGALLEDGTERLMGYVTHQMSKETTPEGRVRRWAAAVLSQATDDIATTTRAILWNAGGPTTDFESGPPLPGSRLGGLLRPALAELGSADPDFDASVISHATVGVLTDYLWRRAQPTPDDVDRMVAFALRVVTPA